jgi:hypothetical protein
MKSPFRTGVLVCSLVAACGSKPSPPPTTPIERTTPAGPSAEELQARHDQDEQAKREQIVAAHRKIEEEQQDALAVTCSEPEPPDKHARCLPSCYPTETADPRATKKLSGAVEVEHLVCQKPGDETAFLLADEIEAGKLTVHPVRGRFPTPHKKGTWQADVEGWLAATQHPKARGDVFVLSGAWRDVTHPLTKEHLHCATASHYARALHKLGGCGVGGDLACEASGNAAARGINVVHYRLTEARELQAAGKPTDCQQAALEAVAVARGLPRWRQYAKLNVQHWADHLLYRTRFDGTLDEDALFAAAASLGSDAEALHVACGGAPGAPTTAQQEQSFHACW